MGHDLLDSSGVGKVSVRRVRGGVWREGQFGLEVPGKRSFLGMGREGEEERERKRNIGASGQGGGWGNRKCFLGGERYRD